MRRLGKFKCKTCGGIIEEQEVVCPIKGTYRRLHHKEFGTEDLKGKRFCSKPKKGKKLNKETNHEQ